MITNDLYNLLLICIFISALTSHDDCILADQQVHASLLDGMQTSAAKCLRFRHNDLEHLAALLTARSPNEGRLIVVDGVHRFVSLDSCARLVH